VRSPPVNARAQGTLGLLASVIQSFASSLDIEDTLHNAVGQIIEYLDAEAASLFLLEEGGEALICRACAGPVDLLGYRLKVDQGIVGKAVREDTVQLIRDVRQDPDFAGFVDAQTGFTTRSALCAPLSVKGKRIGALEVINKLSGDGLFDVRDRHTLQVLASSASLVINNANMAAILVEQERLHKELELAREIQTNLLPPAASEPSSVVGVNVSAREVSGDFYDFYKLADGSIGFSIGDVSGKGMNAALLMAKTSSLLHCLGKSVTEPAQLLARVNDEVCESATRGMFVTAIAGIYDPGQGTVRLANAGHPPALFRRRDGGFVRVPASAPPLGIAEGLDCETVSLSMQGGSLYLVTDGVTEGLGPDGERLGTEGLLSAVEACIHLSPHERLKHIIAAVASAPYPRTDDVTLLVIEDGA
jgi:sigma-B regulation protein RsbU (phosphoserine phosphatase)